jgi:hypothetical protein
MGTPFGFGAGFLDSVGDQFAQNERAALENNLQQRANLWNLHSSILEKARPEAWPAILKNMGTLASLPMGKKLPKELTDFSSLMTPPAGFSQPGQPTPPPNSFDTGSAMASPGQAGTLQAPTPTSGAGIGNGGPSRGMTLPTPGPGFAGPQYNMTSTDTGQPMLGFGPQASPAPPPYSPIYSPEELGQIKATEAGQTARATMQAQIDEREKLIKDHPDWNYQQIELALGHQPTSELGDPVSYIGEHGEKLPGMRNRFTGAVIDQRGQVVPNAQVFDETTPFKVTLAAVLAHGGTPADAANLWNNRYRETSGVVQVVQPDGTIKEVPYTSGSVSGPGVIPSNGLPTPGAGLNAPEPKVTGPGSTVGGRIPATVEKAYQTVNDAETRYATMHDSLPKALAGSQQDMLNIISNHFGMTVQKGTRMTQAIWEEGIKSRPFLEGLLSHFTTTDPATGDRIFVGDPMSGLTLTKPQMESMVDLAKQNLGLADQAYNRLRNEVRNGYGLQSGGSVMMQSPDGTKKPVAAKDVEHYKSKGATVVQ